MVYRLEGLEGVRRKYTDATIINSIEDISSTLTKKMALTKAGSNGALNIWITDKSELCCEFMQFCRRINKTIYVDIKDVLEWYKVWSEKLN
jgi:hypothetical protein